MLYNNIRGITAWGPGLNNREDWKEWFAESDLSAPEAGTDTNQRPPLSELNRKEKRRISRLSATALESAFRICPFEKRGNTETVFSTRHGEIDTTLKLLYEIAGEELISPFKFSHSVHNTPASHFSILSSNHSPSTTLSGHEASFHYGYMEAAQRANIKNMEILYIFCDILLPEELDKFKEKLPFPLSIGMMIAPEQEEKGVAFRFSPHTQGGDESYLPLRFLNWLSFAREPNLVQETDRGSFIWEKKNSDFPVFL